MTQEDARSSDPSTGAELLSVLHQLQQLAQAKGIKLDLHVTVPVKPPEDIVDPIQSVKDRKRQDVLWFQELMQEHSHLAERLAGNYVAVYEEQIIVISPQRKIALDLVKRKLKERAELAVILPLGVRDQDSQEQLDNTLMEVGLA